MQHIDYTIDLSSCHPSAIKSEALRQKSHAVRFQVTKQSADTPSNARCNPEYTGYKKLSS